MTQFKVITACGTEKDGFESRAEAQDGVDVHCDMCEKCGDGSGAVIEPMNQPTADGGPEAVSDAQSPPPEAHDPNVVDESEGYDLPEDGPSVSEDPLVWMPDEFTDTIDGTIAINRKGYEVMAQHYGIETRCECVVGPEETGFEFARCKATAITDDGKEYEAHGSAHVDRGDDKALLVSMSDTRARKRAIAQATGVGMVAVEELKSGVME